jgi:hypothetical protein
MHRDELPIPAPCNENWESMAGGERQRFCERCQHAVHDLSSLTKRQARRLLVQQSTGLCVSYLSNEAGEIQFRSEAPRSLRGVALGVALGVAACSQRTTGEPLPDRTLRAPAAGLTASAAASAAPAASTGDECEIAAPAGSTPLAVPSHQALPSLRRTAGKPMPRKTDRKDPLF